MIKTPPEIAAIMKLSHTASVEPFDPEDHDEEQRWVDGEWHAHRKAKREVSAPEVVEKLCDYIRFLEEQVGRGVRSAER